jgi:hypothetical protein
MAMYDNMQPRKVGDGPLARGSETPVFDRLVTEYRDGFRTVPGDAWTPAPPPRFSELGGGSERFQLPPGQGFGL